MKIPKPSVIHYLLPKIGGVLFICIFMSVVLMGSRLFNLDGDLGRHITIGKYIIESMAIPTTDVFSHTMTGSPLVPHEWLAQIAFALITKLAGLNGDVVLTALVISLTFSLKYREIILTGTSKIIATLVIMWAAAASSIHWLSRPHIFTFLFIAIWTYQLEQFILGKQKKLLLFPILMLIWANTHGAFIAGFVVLGAYFAEWALMYLSGSSDKTHGMRIAAIGLASLAVTFINPSGYHLWETSIGYITNNYLVSHTVEYMSPDFQNFSTWPFLLIIVYGLFSLSGSERIPTRQSLLLAGWATMAMFSMRNIPLFAIITAPIFARLLQTQAGKLKWVDNVDKTLNKVDHQLKGAAWPIVVVMSTAFALHTNIPLDVDKKGIRFDPQVFPVNAIEWLKTHPQNGNVFNHFTWGGYILYETWPGYPVFIDGQTDFYGEPLTREYETVISLNDGWENVLNKYNVNWAIVETNSVITNALANEQHWEILFQDETATILRK